MIRGRRPGTLAAAAIASFAIAWLARERPAAGDPSGEALRDALFPAARSFVARYCADCHASTGANAKHARAVRALRLDTYADWKGHQSVIRGVVDKWHLDGKIMPPASAKAQPSDAERRAIVEWLARGSPNTADGR